MKNRPHPRRLAFVSTAALGLLALGGCRSGSPDFHFEMHLPPGSPPAGASAMIGEISAESLRGYIDRLASFGTRHSLSETESDTRGVGAARRWIRDEFERISAESGRTGDLAIQVYMDRHQIQPDGRRIDVPVELVNPVCVIPGAMPEARNRLYYVIGHYDSRASDEMDRVSDAPGANDDGSGTAVVIELARVLSKLRLDATAVCMATVAEEQGLIGATLHAQDAADAMKDIRAVLSNDIVGDPSSPFGGRNDRHVRVFSEGLPRNMPDNGVARIQSLSSENDSDSRQIARYIAEVGAWHGLPVQAMLMHRPDRFLRGGDHTPFNRLGYPAVRFTVVEEVYERQHQDVRVEGGVQYGDLPEFVDEVYLAGVATLNAAAIMHMANAPSAPGRARIITARLTPETTIRWEPSPEPDTAGYEIVWRETSSPVWTGAVNAGLVTEFTLPMSKDNHYFGVRAYDRDGYRSPVAFTAASPR